MGKIAVVTGGARGIGGGTAERLAREGFEVAVFDLAERSGAALHHQCDIADRAQVEAGFDAVLARWGRVDVLVNNAAANIRRHLVDAAEHEVRRTWDVCLWGAWHCTQLAARQMIRQGGGGNVVTITSVMSEYTAPGSSAYSGAKAALNAMTRTWASELAPHGIRVNAIEPGWIDTPGERITFGEAAVDRGGEGIPLARMGTPADIAEAVAYLVQASYVTGTILRVDGGFTLIQSGP
jgi:glucose 1-dehydrogenase